MRCRYETTESRPGAADGGFQCPKPAVYECAGCGESFCNSHLKVCRDCEQQFCHAPMEGHCYSAHECPAEKKPNVGEVIQRTEELVDQVVG